MSRDYELYLRDILQATERIERYIANVDKDTFKTDDLRVDGVLFNLMTVGEAVKNIPDELRERHPDVRWRDIARFRDRVVHHYFGLDLDIVWEIAAVHLPPLQEFVEQLLQDTDASKPEDKNER